MPGPYQPPRQRAPQAQPEKRLTRRQVVWLSPLVALLPIAVVLAANAITQSASGVPGTPAAATSAAAEPTAPLLVAAAGVAPTAAVGPTSATAILAGTPTAGAAGVTPTAARATASTAASGQPTTAAQPEPTQANPPYIAYTVQPGDTIALVAQRYGVPAASVAQASGLRDADVLHPGQVLTVPRVAGWLYRVQPGETLDQIAARMGVPPDKIAEASSQQAASIRPGYVLLIPDQPAPETAK